MSETELSKEDAVTKKDNEEQVKKALLDPTKKRKAEDEIEIDLKSSIPLSKKQKRLLRRGKVTLEELNAKYNIDPKSIEEYKEDAEKKKSGASEKDAQGEESTTNTPTGDESGEVVKKKKKDENKYGVWIGNLSFDTTKDDLVRFFIAKTKDNEDEKSRVTEQDITRLSMPRVAAKNSNAMKNKGFCYMFFKNVEQMKAVLELSESHLNGRNMLIKDSENYSGRPDKDDLVAMSKNPPSRILFVGNLSFDVTDDLLRKHFQHCGDIVKIRMATFEDSGKCKGFAFIDFKNEEGSTNALKDKSCRKIAGRPLRMEYGEDRSKRQVRKKVENVSRNNSSSFDISNNKGYDRAGQDNGSKPEYKRSNANRRPPVDSNNRTKSSVALATAQRGSAAIVPSQGKKVKFD
ncbi:AFH_G0045520.mRNA.1.CDS.1 [Saccharomyces cerevisiae]|uniref:K7_Nop13p n=1 Tax=Saccharomyces cerevisiae (strain Kyokai no. 7 / NBRC 101557) TaxID=721032 RepID=G2WLT3_YEASK|nr:Nop13p [Saccharomyces cerevisiae YJM195]AJT06453.1 Nop13p [Saccharomyces cerevisiae YJM456]AJT06825.1 Nop13p [Saccharomyces cerevisiae YJM470]AJT08310.1 Nop13p [Saccharomyces cerevisiae YJM627]AJT13995.1 Nop13p [Saccharomyces cerevisiae YJM1083]AJT16228.1 Nop13p [Saccharomyces cerevisiae YJM1208]AJT17352.1 Nop13p [Saccharomyces cerevisiae YJM1248]AJT18478.1 Nop13p [Saccharomyces cerevisiae YJM1273]AJT19582.1 Nop13p [Saccharomyces cerevisiae YJM1311]AJT25866.1 Nop13p [Saccharomyces cerev